MSKHESPMTPEQLADRLNAAWDGLHEVEVPLSLTGVSHPGGPVAPLIAAVTRLAAIDDAPSPAPLFAARLQRELLGRQETPRSIERSTRALGVLPLGGRTALYRLVAAAAFALLASGQLSGHGPLSRLTMTAESPTVSAQTAVAPFAGTLVSCIARPTPSGTSEARVMDSDSVDQNHVSRTAIATSSITAGCTGSDD